jgi:hypothetical protein
MPQLTYAVPLNDTIALQTISTEMLNIIDNIDAVLSCHGATMLGNITVAAA